MKQLINSNTIDSFARTNEALIKTTVKGIILEFPGLGGGSCLGGIDDVGVYDSEFARECAKQGVFLAYVFTGPWSWMNRGGVRIADAVVSAIKERNGLGEECPLVLSGGSMGGLGALIYAADSVHKVTACAAACPCCDVPDRYDCHPAFPRTFVNAVAGYEGESLWEALKTISPIHRIKDMPFVPYYIANCCEDEIFPEEQLDLYVDQLRELGHEIKYVKMPGKLHGEFTQEGIDGLRAFLLWHAVSKDTASGLSSIVEGHEIDTPEQVKEGERTPFNKEHFEAIGVQKVWEKYEGVLNFGEGQCLAIVDDGCDLTVPEWKTIHTWGPKVKASWNAFEQNNDPTPVPPGYHGTSVGYPSSLCYQGLCGIAYRNQTAQIRACTIVHLPKIQGEDVTLARALDWVAEHAKEYQITAVNLSPVDDVEHQSPVPTVLDQSLKRLREMNIWVSAPCGNSQHTEGISWPACQEYCFAIGSVEQGKVINDRYKNTDLLVCAQYTSSSNAYAAGCYMIWREAVLKSQFPWQNYGATMPDAAMELFKLTGQTYVDDVTGLEFRALDLEAAIDFVMRET